MVRGGRFCRVSRVYSGYLRVRLVVASSRCCVAGGVARVNAVYKGYMRVATAKVCNCKHEVEVSQRSWQRERTADDLATWAQMKVPPLPTLKDPPPFTLNTKVGGLGVGGWSAMA